MRVWTKQDLKDWIKSVDPTNENHRKALCRALIFLYNRQTAEEKSSQQTSVDNGQGFTAFDAEFLTSVAEGVKKYGSMTEKQAVPVRNKLAKYAGQLLDMTKSQQRETA